MSAAFALDFSGDPVPCDFPGCVLDAFHEGDHAIGVEVIEKHFQQAGVQTRRGKDGNLYVRCSDATYEYLLGEHKPYEAPLLCRCPQREFPHEPSIHFELRTEAYNPKFKFVWPWSLCLSARLEPSAERKHA